jgi:hypothetical protein
VRSFYQAKKAAREIDLKTDKERRKYMPITRNDCRHNLLYTEIGSSKFETVHN